MNNHFEKIYPGVSFGIGVQLIGMKNIEIGYGTCIGDHTWINVCHRDDKKRIKIGSCVLIGRNSMISGGGYLEIGDYCLFAPRVFISDANHIFENIMCPYVDQGVTSGRIIIEENCWLGINTSIIGNITVGMGSVIAANSIVTKDIPPFSVAAGSPAHIKKIFDFKTTKWIRLNGEEHLKEILAEREKNPPPPRDMYRKILHKNSKTKTIDPIVGGCGISI